MGALSTPNPGGSFGGPSSPGAAGPSQDDFGPSQLAGSSPVSDAGMGADQDAQSDALSAVVTQVRVVEQALVGLAQQFPQAAPEIRTAVDAVRNVLKRIVSSPTDMEQAGQFPRSMA